MPEEFTARAYGRLKRAAVPAPLTLPLDVPEVFPPARVSTVWLKMMRIL
jgi:hypothetical protein